MTSSTSQMSVHLCHDQSPPVETCHTGSVRRRQCVSKHGQRECVRTQLDVFMSIGGDVVSVSVLRHNEIYLNVSCCFVSLKKYLHIYKYSFSTQSNAIQTVENSPQPPLPTALSSDTWLLPGKMSSSVSSSSEKWRWTQHAVPSSEFRVPCSLFLVPWSVFRLQYLKKLLIYSFEAIYSASRWQCLYP